jgi:hypothetical protein
MTEKQNTERGEGPFEAFIAGYTLTYRYSKQGVSGLRID